MSEENRIRFAGLMEEYLNIPSFVCELIEKKLEDNKYKEVIEYVVQRRNEIENKEDYLSEQEKIKRYLDLQQKVEQLETENKELKYDCSCSFHDAEELNQKLTEIIDERNELDTKLIQLENIRKETIDYINKMWLAKLTPDTVSNTKFDLLNILNKGE